MKYRTEKPFVKWAGGKSQLLDDIRAIKVYCNLKHKMSGSTSIKLI